MELQGEMLGRGSGTAGSGTADARVHWCAQWTVGVRVRMITLLLFEILDHIGLAVPALGLGPLS